MTPTTPKQNSNKTALVTGANSGLGFEAAAQLAEAGYGKIILACRTIDKAEGAKKALAERVGSDPYETVAVDVSSVASAEAAGKELVGRGNTIDTVLLNAGMVSGEQMNKSVDGVELAFASSIIGHHVLTVRLLEAGMLADGARVVMSGSESARGDLPAMFDMKLYDFVTGTPKEFGDKLDDAMLNFMKGQGSKKFNPFRHYATTKVFTSWWTAAMARKFGDRASFFTVSPGSNMSTNAVRHTRGVKKFMFAKIMPKIGSFFGMDMPVSEGAGRYISVLRDNSGKYQNGASYMSAPKKMVGPLQEISPAHFVDVERQETALRVLGEITGVPAAA